MQPSQPTPPTPDFNLLVSEMKAMIVAVQKAVEALYAHDIGTKVHWLSVEEFMEHMGFALTNLEALEYIKEMLIPCGWGMKSDQYFHPEDVVKTDGVVRIRTTHLPLEGVSYPRICDRSKESILQKSHSRVTRKRRPKS